jgi:ABC-type multidrug transport system ATPase subunit
VGGIIALGAGMHPHMTGRENIYLNGALYGMGKEEIDEKIDAIIDFSEIEDFMDAPLSTYSSGMKVRLGFSVAVHCQPEILLVDEVLAVGDLSFQNKCMRKLKEVRENSKGVIFISHNMQNIEIICEKVIVLDRGRVVYKDKTAKSIAYYEKLQHEKSRDYESSNFDIKSSGIVTVENIFPKDQENKVKRNFHIGENMKFEIVLDCKWEILDPYLSFALRDLSGNNIFWEVSRDTDWQPEKLKIGLNRIQIDITTPNISSGKYLIVVGLIDSDSGEYHQKYINNDDYILIESDKQRRGMISLETNWIFR